MSKEIPVIPYISKIEQAVNPEHYKTNAFGKELIDIMQANFTKEEFVGYCKGNSIKYRLRAGNKSDDIEQDIKKALWYESKLREIEGQTF